MKIALFGVGSLAALYAEKLHPHGDVILLGNNLPRIDALKKRGFKAYSLTSLTAFKARFNYLLGEILSNKTLRFIYPFLFGRGRSASDSSKRSGKQRNYHRLYS